MFVPCVVVQELALSVTDPEISISGVKIVYHKYYRKIYKCIINKMMTSSSSK